MPLPRVAVHLEPGRSPGVTIDDVDVPVSGVIVDQPQADGIPQVMLLVKGTVVVNGEALIAQTNPEADDIIDWLRALDPKLVAETAAEMTSWDDEPGACWINALRRLAGEDLGD